MEYVGLPAPATPDAVPALVTRCASAASELVWAWLNGTDWRYSGDVPASMSLIDRAILEVAAELYHRKNTKNAVAQFASPDGSPVRIARDPMVAAYPILRQLVGGGFA